MIKKFLVALLIFGGIFSIGNFTNAEGGKINSDLNFQFLGEGDPWYGWVANCNEWISLREYPSTSAPRLAKIPLGARVLVYSDELSGTSGTGFSRVSYNGQYGYCLRQYIVW